MTFDLLKKLPQKIQDQIGTVNCEHRVLMGKVMENLFIKMMLNQTIINIYICNQIIYIF